MESANKIDRYLKRLQVTIENLNRHDIAKVIDILENAYLEKKNIIIFGNGGSASTASHFAADFNKGVSYEKAGRFKVISLCDNIATIMAYSNDLSYEDIFVEQMKNFLQTGDVVIGISGSGNSGNIIKAIEYANVNGGVTIGFSGYDGGLLKKACHHCINSNVDDMQISEDIHLILNHVMMSVLNEGLE
ncbi:MAG: SIS domain-containing protein [Proteobacteria bacterium]|nr:SIS domain-containing protein [Pseudomonadota bacterium]